MQPKRHTIILVSKNPIWWLKAVLINEGDRIIASAFFDILSNFNNSYLIIYPIKHLGFVFHYQLRRLVNQLPSFNRTAH